MKHKITILIAALTIFFTSFASAIDSTDVNGAGFDDLTPAQQAEVIANIASKKAKNEMDESASVVNAKNVNEWVSVGTNIGKGLAGAAKETGTAVNEFAQTPVGILTTVLIVWHYMGDQIVHLMVGLILLFAGFPTAYFIFKKFATEIVYDKSKQVVSKKEEWSGDLMGGYIGVNAVLLIAAIIVIFTA